MTQRHPDVHHLPADNENRKKRHRARVIRLEAALIKAESLASRDARGMIIQNDAHKISTIKQEILRRTNRLEGKTP